MDNSAVIDTDTAKKLTAHIERIEGYEDEKKQVADLIKDEFAIAKGEGFETKIMKHIIKMRKRSADEIQEEEALIEMYRSALGML